MKHLKAVYPDLTADQLTAFSHLQALLLRWNERINLTAITTPEEVQIRHFADSLTVADAVDLSQPLRLIDLGTGAGFPGLPLKIRYPHLDVTLVDSVSKKIRFMDEVIDAFALEGIRTVDARVETIGQDAAHREAYDVVTARALAHMPVLMEYMLPLCAVGGLCVAMKGATAARETEEAAAAIDILGGRVQAIQQVDLPDEEHYLVIVEKIAATPAKYPRRVGIPSKRPLA